MAIHWRYVRISRGRKKAVRVYERRDGCETEHWAKTIIFPLGIGGMSRCVTLTNNVGGRGVEHHAAYQQSEETKQPRTTLSRRKSGKPAISHRYSESDNDP